MLNTDAKLSSLASPDESAAGFVECDLNPLRYDNHVLDPDEVAGVIAGMIPRGARVLDVGCGTGSITKLIQDNCDAQVIGIEPEFARADLAKTRGVNVRTGYLDRQTIDQLGLFDVLLFADVLEHLPNPQAILLLAREALKPGGFVIISVPNIAHWSVRIDIARGRFQYQAYGIMDATHLRWFTAATAKSFVASAGFKITEYRATAGFTLPANVERRPWRWLPTNYRTRLLRSACRRWPTLFGCQHVLKAEIE
jgi:methionine biosynthesis protein MetW